MKYLYSFFLFFFVSHFFIWFVPTVTSTSSSNSTCQTLHDLTYPEDPRDFFSNFPRFWTVYFEGEVKNVAPRVWKDKYANDEQFKIGDYRMYKYYWKEANQRQNDFMDYGALRALIPNILIPLILVRLSFFSKLDIRKRKFRENYLVWGYLAMGVLNLWMAISFH